MSRRSPRRRWTQPAAARQFAEAFGVVGEQVGMPRMTARLLGWLLICEPPQQTAADLAQALEVSRASISIATRLLEASGLLRRVGVPGVRGHVYELDSRLFQGRMDVANPFGALRRVLDQGVALAGGEAAPRAGRVREARDFYAYVERELPLAVERYRSTLESETDR